MKFNCGKTWEERRNYKEEWHVWFAWHPARIGLEECVWLESVERKGTYRCDHECCYWTWKYRLKGSE